MSMFVFLDYDNQNYVRPQQIDLEQGPECDNPECVCNLKKEPEEGQPDNGSYENINRKDNY